MKLPHLFCLAALAPFLGAQTPNEAVLTFVTEPGANKIDIDLDISSFGASSAVSTLTGTMAVRVNIDPGTGTSDELTILSADAGASDVSLSARNSFISRYDFDTTDVRFTLTTPDPPGQVDPESGEFDASQYAVTTTQGAIEGTADTIATAPQEVSFDFGTTPFTGNGAGTGTLTVSPGRIEGRRLYFDLRVELPISLAETIPVPDAPIEITADFSFQGIAVAAGETYLEFPDYPGWATIQGLSSDSPNASDLQPDAPNYFYFALGFDQESAPSSLFDPVSGGVSLRTASPIALDSLEIQWSDDLETWSRIPQNEMLSGQSLMTFGDSLSNPPIVRMTGTRKYLRLATPGML